MCVCVCVCVCDCVLLFTSFKAASVDSLAPATDSVWWKMYVQSQLVSYCHITFSLLWDWTSTNIPLSLFQLLFIVYNCWLNIFRTSEIYASDTDGAFVFSLLSMSCPQHYLIQATTCDVYQHRAIWICKVTTKWSYQKKCWGAEV